MSLIRSQNAKVTTLSAKVMRRNARVTTLNTKVTTLKDLFNLATASLLLTNPSNGVISNLHLLSHVYTQVSLAVRRAKCLSGSFCYNVVVKARITNWATGLPASKRAKPRHHTGKRIVRNKSSALTGSCGLLIWFLRSRLNRRWSLCPRNLRMPGTSLDRIARNYRAGGSRN